MKRALSAPGKLFLSGEYAVLWGGVARVLAVEPRGHALVERRADREIHLHVADGKLTGTLTPYGVQWHQEVTRPFEFAARAIDAGVAAHGKETLGFSLALSPSTEPAPGLKMGVGGSARTVVLVVEAVRYVLEARFDTLKLALWSHAHTQGMKGSGGDVATSFAGGVVRYRRYPVETLSEASSPGTALASAPAVDLRRLQLPLLHVTYAFAGQSASTPRLIDKVEENLDEEARWKFAARSDALGDALESALLGGHFDEVREAVTELHRLLCTLGPIETEGIRQVVALARTAGSVAKLSGAGGGDGCIVFSGSPEAQREVLEAFRARGILSLPLSPAAGLRGETQRDAQLSGWLGTTEA